MLFVENGRRQASEMSGYLQATRGATSLMTGWLAKVGANRVARTPAMTLATGPHRVVSFDIHFKERICATWLVMVATPAGAAAYAR
jgi:hypothetical protein